MSDSEKIETPVAFRVMGNPVEIPGFVHGLRHPCLVVRLNVTPTQNQDQWLSQVNNLFASAIQRNFGDNEIPRIISAGSHQQYAVHSLFFWMSKLQKIAKVPVFEPAKVVGVDSKTSSLLIAIPTHSSLHRSTGKLFFWLLKVFNTASAGGKVTLILEELPLVMKQLEQMVLRASNMPRFLKAAFMLGIPYSEIADQIYQFGYGARKRLLDSSFTDQTSRIGTWFARNKMLTAAVLRIAGIPVPNHKLVSSEKDAETVATELGFPVVVKPADLDGGVGVAAGLTTLEEVRNAFADAHKKSKNILVEKHHEGLDYRLTVFENELIWAIERIPGGVTGDGQSSIRLLLDKLNANPLRGNGPHSPLKRVIIDDEAKLLLLKVGKSEESIPENGEFVCLRRTANIANGGLPVPVLEKVHPDNRMLAIRAAAALHLDFAGVDLLIPDISKSWMEVGAAICEVNAQPDIGVITMAHLYPKILQTLIKGNGRIPIAVIIGASPELDLAAAIAAQLSKAGLATGRVDHKGVANAMGTIAVNYANTYTAGRMAIGEKNINALVMCSNDMSVLQTGLPFERFDLLVFAGTHFSRQPGERLPSTKVQLRMFFDMLSPSCDGAVIVVAEPGEEIEESLALLPAELLKKSVPQHRIVMEIAEAMMNATEKHHC